MSGKLVELCRVDEVPRNGMKLVKMGNLEILIIRLENDFYAYDNRCPHMDYPLFLGSLEGHTLTCGFHYAKFNVKSGEPLNNISERPLKKLELKRLDSQLAVDVSLI
ncbi:MAG: Rieske (2Fe-2S) protein [Candidatus Nezhaarchaeales archaeon]